MYIYYTCFRTYICICMRIHVYIYCAQVAKYDHRVIEFMKIYS